MTSDNVRQGSIFKLNQSEKQRVGKLAGRVKSVTEFLSEASEKMKDMHFPDAISQAAPWAEPLAKAAAGAAGDTVLPLKFLVKLCEKLTEVNDPEELGHVACTIAFERATEKAVGEVGGPVEEKRVVKEVKEQLALLEPSEEVDLGAFTFNNALEHEFFKRAEIQLQAALLILGYGEAQVNRILNAVKDKFVLSLKELLVQRETAEKFAPFKEFIELDGAAERASYRALAEHLRYQRWLFEEAPVLRKSPFALQHVYVETDCGDLTWGDIRPADIQVGARAAYKDRADSRQLKDPFSEWNGGRRNLLKTVMKLISSPWGREPIIVQGVAGAGKSSFALRLCVELQRRLLRPILIRFKDIRFDRHASEALPQAVRLSDEVRSPDGIPPTPEDLFRGGDIFRESGSGEYSKICRYVLILDGWDEISVADEGFRRRVVQILEQIRSEYLDNATRPLPVRIVLTGRPTEAVNASGFLRGLTPILTIRPLTPRQLKGFVWDLCDATRKRPINPLGEDIWPEELNPQKFEPILHRYEDEFTRITNKPGSPEADWHRGGSLGALGLPLLAQLAARLISSWSGNPGQLVDNPTTLYRHLVDLTCRKGGKEDEDAEEAETIKGQFRVVGGELRQLLWETATAMTVYGKDIIPYDELSARLRLEEGELDERAGRAARDHTLSALLISFYFKGGLRHTGCEFAHKSFREYLYAEALVEALKRYAREAADILQERADYWKEFYEDDPRFNFSRELSVMLAPQWMSAEVVYHFANLLEWEIQEAVVGVQPKPTSDTVQLSLIEWGKVRDGLADLWDWWGEGTHLRPQPQLGSRRELSYKDPLVFDLIKHSIPFASASISLSPPATATMDAHLGASLFVLCELVHYHLLTRNVKGVKCPLPSRTAEKNRPPVRRYQFMNSAEAEGKIRFAPSGPESWHFSSYINRINSAGSGHNGLNFPLQYNLRRVDFTSVDLSDINLFGANLEGAILNQAKLNRARLDGSWLDRANLDRASLDRASLIETSLIETSLEGASLRQVRLDGAKLEGAILNRASLERASLVGASLVRTHLYGANLDGANLDGANLDEAKFINAKLVRASLSSASLVGARLNRSSLVEARLDGASLIEANLDGACLDGASVVRANFTGASLNQTMLRRVNLSKALGLTKSQLATAMIDGTTILPPDLSP